MKPTTTLNPKPCTCQRNLFGFGFEVSVCSDLLWMPLCPEVLLQGHGFRVSLWDSEV